MLFPARELHWECRINLYYLQTLASSELPLFIVHV